MVLLHEVVCWEVEGWAGHGGDACATADDGFGVEGELRVALDGACSEGGDEIGERDACVGVQGCCRELEQLAYGADGLGVGGTESRAMPPDGKPLKP